MALRILGLPGLDLVHIRAGADDTIMEWIVVSEDTKGSFTPRLGGSRPSSYIDRREIRWDLRVFQRIGRSDDGELIQIEPFPSPSHIREAIERIVEVQWRGECWGVHFGDGFCIEFDIGQPDEGEEGIESFGLTVIGEGECAELLSLLAQANAWVYCDTASGEVVEAFSSLGQAGEGLRMEPASPAEGVAAQGRFHSAWFNLHADRNNLVAINDDTLLIATASVEQLYRLIDQYEIKGWIAVDEAMLQAGSHAFPLSSVIEVIDNREGPRCEIIFSRLGWPVDVAFASDEDKASFMDLVLNRVSEVKHAPPRRVTMGSLEVLLLILALVCAAVGALSAEIGIILIGLLILFYVVHSLMRRGSGRDKKEVHRFG